MPLRVIDDLKLNSSRLHFQTWLISYYIPNARYCKDLLEYGICFTSELCCWTLTFLCMLSKVRPLFWVCDSVVCHFDVNSLRIFLNVICFFTTKVTRKTCCFWQHSNQREVIENRLNTLVLYLVDTKFSNCTKSCMFQAGYDVLTLTLLIEHFFLCTYY